VFECPVGMCFDLQEWMFECRFCYRQEVYKLFLVLQKKIVIIEMSRISTFVNIDSQDLANSEAKSSTILLCRLACLDEDHSCIYDKYANQLAKEASWYGYEASLYLSGFGGRVVLLVEKKLLLFSCVINVLVTFE